VFAYGISSNPCFSYERVDATTLGFLQTAQPIQLCTTGFVMDRIDTRAGRLMAGTGHLTLKERIGWRLGGARRQRLARFPGPGLYPADAGHHRLCHRARPNHHWQQKASAALKGNFQEIPFSTKLISAFNGKDRFAQKGRHAK
jgi:hypothetical protein